MLGNASRSATDLVDVSILEDRLSRSRIEPEFTMQVVCNETGVPPETLRSWERRHGFPNPGRTESGRRRYSERDIAAVNWLRHQTERGQGISDAIAMLRRLVPDEVGYEAPAPVDLPEPRQPERALAPVQTLADALLGSDLHAAQVAWDRLSLATSPDALATEVLLPAWRRLLDVSVDPTVRLRAVAFLDRKAVVLYDLAAPDSGIHDAALVVDDTASLLPAHALGSILARSGYRIVMPILDISQATTLAAISALHRDTPVLFVAPGSSGRALDGYRAIVPGVRFLRWWPDEDGTSAGDEWLPPDLHKVPSRLQEIG